MNRTTLMVHLELDRSNSRLLSLTDDLAERLQATVIGIAAFQPMPVVYGEGYVSGELIEQDRLTMERSLGAAETEFRSALHLRGLAVEWRSAMTCASLSDHLARESRAADILITGPATGDAFDASRSLNLGDLVMHAGRPVLIVPPGVTKLGHERAVVAWKDTREARRAVADALPLLRLAREVCVVEIAADAELAEARLRVGDVARWLHRHGIEATAEVSASADDNATALLAWAHSRCADLIVAGAYGHSRLREWALGGMTRELIKPTDCCSLLSH
jgi:nucleotide-binding universal stress UspA family protein